MHVEVFGGNKIEITKADIQAVRQGLRRSKDMVDIDDLRRLLRARINKRPSRWPFDDVRHAANEAVARLLSKWKREGLADNPVRGHWVWLGATKQADAVVEADDPAIWAVRRDGETEESIVTGYNNGDRGLVAHDFAGADLERWDDGSYKQLLWVRQVKPNEESEDQAVPVRVKVYRDSGARSERRKGGSR